MNLLAQYTRWLHTQWPAGLVKSLPRTGESVTVNIPGAYVVGDLRCVPLLKFAADTGAKAVAHILADPQYRKPLGGASPAEGPTGSAGRVEPSRSSSKKGRGFSPAA